MTIANHNLSGNYANDKLKFVGHFRDVTNGEDEMKRVTGIGGISHLSLSPFPPYFQTKPAE